MKKSLIPVLIIVLIMGLSGCMYNVTEMTINEDGSGQLTQVVLFEKNAYEVMMESFVEQGYSVPDVFEGQVPEITVIDDVEYYMGGESKAFSNLEDLEKLLSKTFDDVFVSETGIRFIAKADGDLSSDEIKQAYSDLGVDINSAYRSIIKLNVPQKIQKYSKGGEISDDGLSVAFTFDFDQMCQTQDVMVSTAKETTKPSISVTHKKTYKNAKTVTVSDASGIKEAKYKKKGGSYTPFNHTMTFVKNGTYTVTAKDYYGNSRTRTFTVKDETKPKVKGVSNNKTYDSERFLTFSDNCGISSVTLYTDGVKLRLPEAMVKDGIPVTEAADYKVFIKDINGNTRTVKFTIK